MTSPPLSLRSPFSVLRSPSPFMFCEMHRPLKIKSVLIGLEGANIYLSRFRNQKLKG